MLAAQVVWAELAVAAVLVLSLLLFCFCQPRYKLVLADGQVLEATVPNLHKYMGGELCGFSDARHVRLMLLTSLMHVTASQQSVTCNSRTRERRK